MNKYWSFAAVVCAAIVCVPSAGMSLCVVERKRKTYVGRLQRVWVNTCALFIPTTRCPDGRALSVRNAVSQSITADSNDRPFAKWHAPS